MAGVLPFIKPKEARNKLGLYDLIWNNLQGEELTQQLRKEKKKTGPPDQNLTTGEP
jgi:hypothetical protein